MTCTAATNSAPSSRYSAASAPMTTTKERALFTGCRCASRLIAPATAMAANAMNSPRCSIRTVTSRIFRTVSLTRYSVLLRPQPHHQRRNYQVRDGERQQHLPSKCHQLVVAKARQSPAHPDIQKDKKEHAQREPEHRQDVLQSRRSEHRSMPAA